MGNAVIKGMAYTCLKYKNITITFIITVSQSELVICENYVTVRIYLDICIHLKKGENIKQIFVNLEKKKIIIIRNLLMGFYIQCINFFNATRQLNEGHHL